MVFDPRLLEAFRTVVEAGSVTAAAKMLGVTQPAVSAQIARLETQAGFELFERASGRLVITFRGRRFYEEIRTALDVLERLGQAARGIRSGETESLAVAGHPSASISLLPEVVAELRRRRPDARISLINRSSEEVAAAFEAGAVDLAVAEWPIHVQGVELRRHAADCVAIVPAGHPLAARDALTPADLAAHPIVGMSDRRLIGHRVRELFLEDGLGYDPVIVSEFFSAICGLVAAGAGVAIVDAWSARTFAPMGIVARPFRPALRYEIGVFRRASASPTPLAEELMALIETRLSAPLSPPSAPAPETDR